MKIKDILTFLGEKAHFSFQESYDNSGLLTGHPDMESNGILVSLDCTEAVVAEAIARGVNTIVAHHPIVFTGLKRFTGSNYVERTIIAAIKNDIAIIAIHTNLDNIVHGVNARICDELGLVRRRILDPKSGLLHKIITFVPDASVDTVRNAMFEAGAGNIGNYSECSFSTQGSGTFKAGADSQPFVGEQHVRHTEGESRLEVICPKHATDRVVQAMKRAHPYEEVAHDVVDINNRWDQIGSGMIGELETPMPSLDFLIMLKNRFGGVVRYTSIHQESVQRIAVCGGSGSFLLKQAIREKADVFVTADFKYHQFFDAENQLIIADLGHFETEQYTIDLLIGWFAEKFPTFATHKTGVVTNPINYL
ncbi:MAG: Nif3-like dinuclear metal center hexameric protein [Flavobacteriales bacterium]